MEKLTFVERIEATGRDSGKPYTRLNIKVASRGDVKLSGFGNAQNAKWSEGQTVNIIITENGKYLNFTMAESKKGEELASSMKIDNVYSVVLNTQTLIMKLCEKNGISTGYEDVQKARETFNANRPKPDGFTSHGADGEAPIKSSDVNFSGIEYPTDDINPDDIPF